MPRPFEDVLIRHRMWLLVALHVVIFAGTYLGAFLLRFDLALELEVLRRGDGWLTVGLPAFVVAKLLAFAVLRQFSGWWRYVSLDDLLGISKATAVGVLLATATVVAFELRSFPRSIFLLDAALTVLTLAGLRVVVRVVRERALGGRWSPAPDAVRTLVVGTGPTAEGLVRELSRNRDLKMNLIGLVAEDERVVGTRLSGARILGSFDDLPSIAAERDVQQVVIALEDQGGETMRRLVRLCSAADVKHRVLPPTDALLHGTVSLSSLREVDLRDLLGRPPVRLSNEQIARQVNTRTILVTGAGGSIGSELCRQVALFGPSRLVLVEQAENPLFHLERELAQGFPGIELVPIVADVYDSERLDAVMRAHEPAMVLHAAAHKHVPLMEANPSEAVKNNVIGTLNVIRAAQGAGVETCVLISTDKAVNPTSVMGASKRVAEMLLQALAVDSGTKLAAVRFGNVLGSNGSVIPIFKQQIAEGGPVTVTHPEMRRYFMTIPEASQLVLQAATFANAGDIFVLDMGEPVLIVDIARDLIRLSGLEPDKDVMITFTGMRPGEKLFEELATDAERQSRTDHRRIFRCEVEPPDHRAVLEAALQLEKLARSTTAPNVIRRELFAALARLERGTSPQPTVVAFDSARKSGSMRSL